MVHFIFGNANNCIHNVKSISMCCDFEDNIWSFFSLPFESCYILEFFFLLTSYFILNPFQTPTGKIDASYAPMKFMICEGN